MVVAQRYGLINTAHIYKFLGDRLNALFGTLGGVVFLADGVTTLGSCGEF
jgi:hypothetical protein